MEWKICFILFLFQDCLSEEGKYVYIREGKERKMVLISWMKAEVEKERDEDGVHKLDESRS